MRSDLVRRARFLSGAFLAVSLIIGVRLYFLQVIHGDDFRAQALSQYVESTPDTSDRGSIFFTAKDGALVAGALMQRGWRVAINPERVTDAQKVYDSLNTIVLVERERFFASAAKKDDPYEEVAFKLSDDQAAAVRALKLSGVQVVSDRTRLYPGGDLAAHSLGFVGYISNTKAGRYGLERSWETTLAHTGSGLYINPFAEIFANVQSLFTSDPAAQQGDVVTSIEPTVQQHLEDTLDEVMKTYTPQLAGGIIMDPHTGAIVALAARPDFDPNTFNTAPDASVFANPLVESVFEMGSIMKPLTMAAGIDAGAVSTTTVYNDTGCVDRSGYTICNYDKKARHTVPMQEVLSQSLNLGVTFVEETMGRERFATYVRAYGLGEKTGIDLPNEATGMIGALKSGSDIDYATASFGQGIGVSAIAMTRALSTLANGGVLPSPHMVKAVRYESGLSRSVVPEHDRRVLKSESAATVTRMLVTVYDKALLHGALKDPHYSIAAKTGTAQIARPECGGYCDGEYLHSFFGYFPAYDPKFIVFLFVVEPRGVQYASETLARPFGEVKTFLVHYYDIPPDR